MVKESVAAIAVLMLTGAASGTDAAAPGVRRFEVRYSVTVPALPPGGRQLRMWLPYPESDAWQSLDGVVVDAPFPHSVRQRFASIGRSGCCSSKRRRSARRRRAGDDALRGDAAGVGQPSGRTASRRGQRRRPEAAATLPSARQARTAARARSPRWPGEATADAHTQVEKARAIYDYVTTHLHYDKSGTGWGRGDAVWACDNKRGNCTDFHSLLIGMARSVGIPAKFEIGLPIPEDKRAGAIGGYHCWAASTSTASAGCRSTARRRASFRRSATTSSARSTSTACGCSVGRDITLDPPQHGPPLNYFVYPYAEVDGEPLAGVTHTLAFRDLGSAAAL